MSKDDLIEMEWVVEQVLWFGDYKVKLDGVDKFVTCKMKWKMKNLNKIKIIMWDRVRVTLSPEDRSRGYIVYRLK